MFFDINYVMNHLSDLFNGLLMTVRLTIICFVIAVVLGLLLGIVRFSKPNKALYGIVTIYIEIMRNTPFLVQLFFVFYGLAQFGLKINANPAAIIVLSLNSAAYFSEIFRAGIQSTPKGQWEAGRCIGLSEVQLFLSIILPQAIHDVFPSITNQFVIMLFATSVCSIIDVRDLTQTISILSSQSYRNFELFTTGMVLYYCLAIIFIVIFNILYKKAFNYTKR